MPPTSLIKETFRAMGLDVARRDRLAEQIPGDYLRSSYLPPIDGGLILFDEYEDPTFPGTKPAIDEFFADKPEKPVRYDDYGYVTYHVVKS